MSLVSRLRAKSESLSIERRHSERSSWRAALASEGLSTPRWLESEQASLKRLQALLERLVSYRKEVVSILQRSSDPSCVRLSPSSQQTLIELFQVSMGFDASDFQMQTQESDEATLEKLTAKLCQLEKLKASLEVCEAQMERAKESLQARLREKESKQQGTNQENDPNKAQPIKQIWKFSEEAERANLLQEFRINVE